MWYVLSLSLSLSLPPHPHSPHSSVVDSETIDPRIKSKLGKCEDIKKIREHDTSPWSGNASQKVVFPVHKLSNVRDRQSHDTTPWGTTERHDDSQSLVSTVSTIAPWDRDDIPTHRHKTRAHFHDRQNRTTRLWSVKKEENDPTSSRQIVLDMIRAGLKPQEIMSRLEKMFPEKKNKKKNRGRRKKETWPDGTVRLNSTSGYSLLRKVNGETIIVLPNGLRVPFMFEEKDSKDNIDDVPKMPFSNVYSDRYNGKDTESQIVFGGGKDKRSKMSFSNVFSDRFNGKNTESQIVFGGGEDENKSSKMAFSRVYSDRFNGKDTESQIVFGDGSTKMSPAGVKSTRHGPSFMKRLIEADLVDPPRPPVSAVFVPCPEFSGLREGYTYRKGLHGRGYYTTLLVPPKATTNNNNKTARTELLHEATQAVARASRDKDRRGSL